MSSIQAAGPNGPFSHDAGERRKILAALAIPPGPPIEDTTGNARRQQEEYASDGDDEADEDARAVRLDSNSEDDLVEDEDMNVDEDEDGGIRAEMYDAIRKGPGILELVEVVKKSKLSSQPQRIATLVPGGKQASLVINGDSLDRTRPVHWRFTPSTRVYGSHRTGQSYNVNGRSVRVETFKTPVRYICIPKTDFDGDTTQNWGFIGGKDKEGKEHSVTLTVDHGQYLADPSLKFEFARAAVGKEKPAVPLLYAEYRPGLKSSQDVDAFDIEEHYICFFEDLVTEKPHIAGIAKQSLPADLQKDPLHDTIAMVTFTRSGRLTFLQSTKVVQDESIGNFAQISGTIRNSHDNVHIMIFTPEQPEEYAIHRSEHSAHWDLLIQHRFPPMSNFYDTDTMMPFLHLGLETVNELHDSQYVNFGKVVNEALRSNYLKKNPLTHPVNLESAMNRYIDHSDELDMAIEEYANSSWFSGPYDFYIKFGVGVIQNYQYTALEAATYQSTTHQAIVFAPFGKAATESTAASASSYVDLRKHFYVFVKRGKGSGDYDLEDLPEGTVMLMNLPSIYQKPIEGWWSGVICPNPLEDGTFPPHDFCMYMNKPSSSSELPVVSRREDLINASSTLVRLKAAVNSQPEQCELDALRKMCIVENEDLAAQRNTLVYQKELFGDEKQDLRRGPPGLTVKQAEANVKRWDRALKSMIKYEGLEDNTYMVAAMCALENLSGSWTVFVGAAGSVRSRMSANLMLLQELVGWQPVVVSKEDEAVDVIASAHAAARNRALREWRLTDKKLYSDLSRLQHYRFEASGVPDLESIRLMAEDLEIKQDGTYSSQTLAVSNIASEPIMQSLFETIAALGHYDATDVDSLPYSDITKRRIRKARNYPTAYSVASLLQTLVENDIQSGRAWSQRYVELKTKLDKDERLSTDEFTELTQERNNQIAMLISKCGATFTTISACGTELFKKSLRGDRRILWIEDASEVSVASSIAAMEFSYAHIFVSGDGNESTTIAKSQGYNVAIAYANKNILSFLQDKNMVTYDVIPHDAPQRNPKKGQQPRAPVIVAATNKKEERQDNTYLAGWIG